MIRENDFYHGAVLSRLVNAGSFPTEIRPFNSDSNCAYVVNGCVGLYIKYSTHRMSPWRFTFRKEHQDELLAMKRDFRDVFLILVCETDGIVALNFEEVRSVLDSTHRQTEWISATRRKRQQYTIKGSDGLLDFKISDSEFPFKLFEVLGPPYKTPHAK